MAEKAEQESEAEDAPAPPKKSRKKLLMIVIPAVVVVLLGAGAGLYFTGMLNSLLGGKKDVAAADHAPAKPKDPTFSDLPDMLVNLSVSGRKANFLKITISLELDRKEDQPAVTAAQPRIIDTFQTYLRELRPEDLRGSAGLYRLREELLSRVNLAVAPARIDDVLFKEMLVQ